MIAKMSLKQNSPQNIYLVSKKYFNSFSGSNFSSDNMKNPIVRIDKTVPNIKIRKFDSILIIVAVFYRVIVEVLLCAKLVKGGTLLEL